MRLLDTETGQFVEKDLRAWTTVFAILSHTWDTEKGEQTYKELKKIQRRYGPSSQVPQSWPHGPQGIVSSSPEQDRGGPSPSLSPSQLPNNCPSVTTSLILPSRPSKPWFTRRISRFKKGFQCRSLRTGSRIPSDASADVSSTPSSARASRSNDDHPPPLSDSSRIPPEQQTMPPSRSIWDDPELSPKIRDACAVARKNGYRYIWIDSCCIDKSSSSELSEAINSMYKWYSLANVCYAHLADVPSGQDHHALDSRFRESRWFQRGWTLQELIAPVNVEFLSRDWSPIGSKHALDSLIESITGISRRALLHVQPLSHFSVAQRFSWAARRETTREEDRAYSLLGLFDISMPTLYGEGNRAFQRLQEQIMQRIPDQSLFAWGDVYLSDYSQPLKNQVPIRYSITLDGRTYGPRQSLFTLFPAQFSGSGYILRVEFPASLHYEIGYMSTPYGIRTQFQMIPLTPDFLSRVVLPSSKDELELSDDWNRWYLAILGCEHMTRPDYLLGQVCYIPPSQSGVEFVYAGFIWCHPTAYNLFRLSPDVIEDFRSHLELKTVHIPHPDPANQFWSVQNKPYNTIKLLLLTETREALRYAGYHANLRDPDPDRPTTHRLILSNDEHTITAGFQHTLRYDGRELTIDAAVEMTGSCAQLGRDSVPDSDQADRHTMSWTDDIFFSGWQISLGSGSIRLSTTGAETLIVDLSLQFVGLGVYYVHVNVWRDALAPAPADVDSAQPASPVVESAGEKAEEVGVTGDDLPSVVVDTEDSEAGREVEAAGYDKATGANIQDFEDAVVGEHRDRAA